MINYESAVLLRGYNAPPEWIQSMIEENIPDERLKTIHDGGGFESQKTGFLVKLQNNEIRVKGGPLNQTEKYIEEIKSNLANSIFELENDTIYVSGVYFEEVESEVMDILKNKSEHHREKGETQIYELEDVIAVDTGAHLCFVFDPAVPIGQAKETINDLLDEKLTGLESSELENG